MRNMPGLKKIVLMLLAVFRFGESAVDRRNRAAEKIIIAHRGAPGYLPEHTLASKALAIGMGADYIEQDIVLSKDNKLLVLHDHYLDTTTDVAQIFPGRNRSDGRFYSIDFNLDEIKKLKKTSTFSEKTGTMNYAGRFPLWESAFSVNTFEEELEMVRGMEKSMKKPIGIYPEIKTPWFHRAEGRDITMLVLDALKKYNYTSISDQCFLQCFNVDELKRIKNHLFPSMGMDLKLVQLMAETSWNQEYVDINGQLVPYNYDWMYEVDGMAKIAEYAQGVGPWKPMVIEDSSTKGDIKVTQLVDRAHKAGLLVHPYTFRADQGRIPSYADDFQDLVQIFFEQAGVDGIFTDFPDLAVKALRDHPKIT